MPNLYDYIAIYLVILRLFLCSSRLKRYITIISKKQYLFECIIVSYKDVYSRYKTYRMILFQLLL